MNHEGVEESEFRKRLREKEEFIDNSYKRSISALTGAMIGQGMDGPLQALSRDLKARREKPLIENGENVVEFSDPNQRKERIRNERIRRSRRKGYRPTFGVPKSKSAILGGVIGGMAGPTIIDDIKAIQQERRRDRDNKRLIDELEKEASDNYRSLPILDKKY